MKPQFIGLVGDVGGTNARFALIDQHKHIRFPRTFPAREYQSLTDVIAEYLRTTAGGRLPPRAAIAVAGPVVEGAIEFTNLHWQVSEMDLIAHFEFEAVTLLNDFAAQAIAAPRLAPDDLTQIGPRLKGAADAPIVVLGAGTGFGVAGLARAPRSEIAIATEGGHAGFAPYDDYEIEILKRFYPLYGRVSIERLLSGRGMFDLYRAMADIEGQPAPLEDEKAVFAAGEGGDPLAEATLDRFCAILGGVAGDLALSFGARGGAYISGGIAPRMIERLNGGTFRTRFEAKGRLSDYVRDIPTFLITHPYAAMVGAAREIEQMERVLQL